MSLDALLDNSLATLQLQVTVPDSSGGKVITYTDSVSAPVRIQDAKTEIKQAYASKSIVVTNTIFTKEGSGRAGDRWYTSEGYHLIVGIRKRRELGGIETYYLYDTRLMLAESIETVTDTVPVPDPGPVTSPPNAPVIALSTYGTNYITITWAAVENATTIKLYKDAVLVTEISASLLTYTYTGLTSSTSYSLTAKMSNTSGDSSLSNTVTQTTAGVSGRSLLSPGDFTLLGQYRVSKSCGTSQGGGELQYGQGFTHRYVSGQLRFLTYGYLGGYYHLNEFIKPSSYGSTISTVTNAWSSLAAIGWWHGIWWDEENSRLMKTQGIDYPDASNENNRLAISTIQLGASGATSNPRGRWGLTGIPDRRVMGGVVKIPTWFQSLYSVGKYGVGFGGYASRMAVNPVSLGLTLYAIPEPSSTSDESLLPSFHTLADHGSGTVNDDSQALISLDRGARSLSVTNEYDSGNWNEVYSDGYRRWVWGDTAANTGCWIDNDAGTRSKHGFIIVPALSTGRAYYQNSSTNAESRGSEIQIFNPDHFGEVKAGTRQPWQVQPIAYKDITSLIAGHTSATAGYNRPGCVEGATFDSTTNILYVYCTFNTLNNYDSTIYAFSVAGS